MKKIMLSAAMLAFAGMATVNAETIKNSAAIEVSTLQDRTPVKAENLPDAVKTKLTDNDYAGWEVKEAHSVQSANGTYFEISLQKGDESRTVNLNEAGEVAEPTASSETIPSEQAIPADQSTTDQSSPVDQTTPTESTTPDQSTQDQDPATMSPTQ